jgi:hypothetical protein
MTPLGMIGFTWKRVRSFAKARYGFFTNNVTVVPFALGDDNSRCSSGSDLADILGVGKKRYLAFRCLVEVPRLETTAFIANDLPPSREANSSEFFHDAPFLMELSDPGSDRKGRLFISIDHAVVSDKDKIIGIFTDRSPEQPFRCR